MDDISAKARQSETIEIPEGITEIHDGAFKGMDHLRSVTFPQSLKVIGKEAFCGCSKLKIPPIPASVNRIGEKAFFGCSSIEKFKVEVGNDSFHSYKGVLYGKGDILVAYPAGCGDRQFAVLDRTERIEDYAFCGCTNLERVEFGDKLKHVTGRAFTGCRRLAEIYVPPRNDTFDSYAGDLYRDNGTELVFMCPSPRRHLESISAARRLGAACLAECDKIDNLILHNTMEEIAPDAFGEKCRPKILNIGRYFDLDLPFEFVSDEDDMDETDYIRGAIYRRRLDGKYEFLESLPKDIPFYKQFDEPETLRFGGPFDDEESEMEFRPISIEGEGFDKIAGLEDAKELIYNHLILPAKHPELFDRFDLETSTGVLLYGPPGTGKTMLARAVASEVQAKFYSIKSTDIRNCLVGESENNIRKLFETARKDERAVIFFDDFDSLGRQRGNRSEPWQSDLINELLVQMQGVERHKGNLMVLAATNRPWDVDSALKRSGRFTARIYVGLPNKDARLRIITNSIDSVPHAIELDMDRIATMTEGYNGADVEEVCRTAKMHRVVMMDSGSTTDRITQADFDFALSRVYTSVSNRDMKEIEDYRRTGCGPGSADEYIPKEDKLEGYS